MSRDAHPTSSSGHALRKTLAVGGLTLAVALGAAPAAHADLFTSPATGTHDVHGDILARYNAVGGPGGALGYPTTDEQGTPRVYGAVNHFQYGSIYWSPASGAHAVRGAIRDTWAALGWENGTPGFPVTDESPVRGGAGQHFQGGSIYWSGPTGAHEVHGAIRDKWASLGWENSELGFPTTNELGTPNRRGVYTGFSGGSIYFSPATGAQAVRGAIRDRWGTAGYENGFLGFPTTSETPVAGGAVNHFQGGSIYWSPANGAHIVQGAIRDKWASMGWQESALGFPTTGEYDVPGGKRENFERGSITWTPQTGAQVDPPSVAAANARQKAQDYLKYSAFSRSGLIEQLQYEKFSLQDSTWAVDSLGVDWYQQAVKKGASYLKYSSFSRDGLIDQLEYEGFTHDQAVYGTTRNGL
ncbi:Ltp family lipoprotein [Modestobacter sp. L9-4]|uniref:Ltp family lipoprotein n=1 Tax=Modestobacter sp. L9-4 TaxID=2851567 RepID=UPI001C74BF29|nr:Ltp family lipoprotein [Modestobacter sp. L9-4]QXG76197.1 Ltp family lipoprotein [Modestobacter sp. L9-4]